MVGTGLVLLLSQKRNVPSGKGGSNGKDSGTRGRCAVLRRIFVVCLVFFRVGSDVVQLQVENLAYIDAPCQQLMRGLVGFPSELNYAGTGARVV